MEEKNDARFIEIFSGSLWQADLIKGLLEANEIPSMLKDETLSVLTGFYSNIGGEVKVFVDELDFATAKRVIEESEIPEQAEDDE